MFSSILVFKFAFFNFLVKLETLIFNDRRKIKLKKKTNDHSRREKQIDISDNMTARDITSAERKALKIHGSLMNNFVASSNKPNLCSS